MPLWSQPPLGLSISTAVATQRRKTMASATSRSVVRVPEPPEKGFELRWWVTSAWMVRANVNIVAITARTGSAYVFWW